MTDPTGAPPEQDDPELTDAIAEIRRTLGPGPKTEMLVSMMRAFRSLPDSPAGRVVKGMIDPENAPLLDAFKDPRERNRYKLRAANTVEFGPRGFQRRLLKETAVVPAATTADIERMTAKVHSRRLARTLRSELEPMSRKELELLREEVGRSILTSQEQAGFLRFMKVGTQGLDFDALREDVKKGRFDLAAQTGLRSSVSAALIAIPPPSGESFGRRNRSTILLSTDRKKCAWATCQARVRNASRFCPKHAIAARKGKAAERKARQRARLALRAEQARVAAKGAAVPVSSPGLPVGSVEPGEDLRTKRRRLQAG